jgi:hypothetical protein
MRNVAEVEIKVLHCFTPEKVARNPKNRPVKLLVVSGIEHPGREKTLQRRH